MKINGMQYTGRTLSLVLDAVPVSLDRAHPAFAEILLLVRNALAQGSLEEESTAKSVDDVLRKYEKASIRLAIPGTGVEIVDGVVLLNGGALSGFVADRLVQMVDEAEANDEDPELALTPLAKFLTRLQQHPWNSANAGFWERNMFQALEQDLYRFLEHGKMPLTLDGAFLAYKAISADWYSIHSGDLRGTTGTVVKVDGVETSCWGTPASGNGTIRNMVGDKPRIPLNMVNPNRDETCSYGLHVCSFDYLPGFSHANGHVVLCKVGPEDVGSIPADYNDTKMRVCAYEVVEEFSAYYTGERANWGAVYIPSESEEDAPPEREEDDYEENGEGDVELADILPSSDDLCHAFLNELSHEEVAMLGAVIATSSPPAQAIAVHALVVSKLVQLANDSSLDIEDEDVAGLYGVNDLVTELIGQLSL